MSARTTSWNPHHRQHFLDFKVLAGLTAFMITISGGALAFGQIFTSQEVRSQAAVVNSSAATKVIDCYDLLNCWKTTATAIPGCRQGFATSPSAACRQVLPCCLNGQTLHTLARYQCLEQGGSSGYCTNSNGTVDQVLPCCVNGRTLTARPRYQCLEQGGTPNVCLAANGTGTSPTSPSTGGTTPTTPGNNNQQPAVATPPTSAKCQVVLVDPNDPTKVLKEQKNVANGTEVRFKCEVTTANTMVDQYDMALYIKESVWWTSQKFPKTIPMLNSRLPLTFPVRLDSEMLFDCIPKSTRTGAIGEKCSYYQP